MPVFVEKSENRHFLPLFALPDKRDLLSLGRSVENVWSFVTRAMLSFGRDVVAEGRKLAVKAVLMALLGAAVLMVPVVGKIPGAQWIETAYTFFKSVVGQPPPSK